MFLFSYTSVQFVSLPAVPSFTKAKDFCSLFNLEQRLHERDKRADC